MKIIAIDVLVCSIQNYIDFTIKNKCYKYFNSKNTFVNILIIKYIF